MDTLCTGRGQTQPRRLPCCLLVVANSVDRQKRKFIYQSVDGNGGVGELYGLSECAQRQVTVVGNLRVEFGAEPVQGVHNKCREFRKPSAQVDVVEHFKVHGGRRAHSRTLATVAAAVGRGHVGRGSDVAAAVLWRIALEQLIQCITEDTNECVLVELKLRHCRRVFVAGRIRFAD